MEVKGQLVALLSPHSNVRPQDLGHQSCLSSLTTVDERSLDYFIGEGYTKVGVVEMCFTPMGMEDLVKSKIEALRAESESIRAKATAQVTKIEGQIQNLLAIGFDKETVFQKNDETDIPF